MPVPDGNVLAIARPGYEMEQRSGYTVPDGYIRFPRRAAGEDDMATCEYCLEVSPRALRRVVLGRSPLFATDLKGFLCRGAMVR